MKFIVSFLMLIGSQALLADQYLVNCLSEGSTPFAKSIIITGELLTNDINSDGKVDHISGDLNIQLPYLNYSHNIKVDGEAFIDDYIHTQYLYARPKITHSSGLLGSHIEITESPYRGGPAIRISHDFEIYKCLF